LHAQQPAAQCKGTHHCGRAIDYKAEVARCQTACSRVGVEKVEGRSPERAAEQYHQQSYAKTYREGAVEQGVAGRMVAFAQRLGRESTAAHAQKAE
jgi:hypothetical protein